MIITIYIYMISYIFINHSLKSCIAWLTNGTGCRQGAFFGADAGTWRAARILPQQRGMEDFCRRLCGGIVVGLPGVDPEGATQVVRRSSQTNMQTHPLNE